MTTKSEFTNKKDFKAKERTRIVNEERKLAAEGITLYDKPKGKNKPARNIAVNSSAVKPAMEPAPQGSPPVQEEKVEPVRSQPQDVVPECWEDSECLKVYNVGAENPKKQISVKQFLDEYKHPIQPDGERLSAARRQTVLDIIGPSNFVKVNNPSWGSYHFSEHNIDGTIIRPIARIRMFRLLCTVLQGKKVLRMMDCYGAAKQKSFVDKINKNCDVKIELVVQRPVVVAEDITRRKAMGKDKSLKAPLSRTDPYDDTCFVLDEPVNYGAWACHYDAYIFQDVQHACISREAIGTIVKSDCAVAIIVHWNNGYCGPSGESGYFVRVENGVLSYPHPRSTPYLDTQEIDWIFDSRVYEDIVWSIDHIIYNVYVVVFTRSTGALVNNYPLEKPRVGLENFAFTNMSDLEKKFVAPNVLWDNEADCVVSIEKAHLSEKEYLSITKQRLKSLPVDYTISDKVYADYISRTVTGNTARKMGADVMTALRGERWYINLLSTHPTVCDDLYAGTLIYTDRRITRSTTYVLDGMSVMGSVKGYTRDLWAKLDQYNSSIDPSVRWLAIAVCLFVTGAIITSVVEWHVRVVVIVIASFVMLFLTYASLRFFAISLCSCKFVNPKHASLLTDLLNYDITDDDIEGGVYHTGPVRISPSSFEAEKIGYDQYDPSFQPEDVHGCVDVAGRLNFTSFPTDKVDLMLCYRVHMPIALYQGFYPASSSKNMQFLFNDVLGITNGYEAQRRHLRSHPVRALCMLDHTTLAPLTHDEKIVWANRSIKAKPYVATIDKLAMKPDEPLIPLINVMVKANQFMFKPKVRNIAVPGDEMTVTTGPYIDIALQRLKVEWQENISWHKLGRYSYKPMYGGCTTTEKLSSLLTQLDDLPAEHVAGIVSGDDSGMGLSLKLRNIGAGSMAGARLWRGNLEGDASSFDRSEGPGALEVEMKYLAKLGIPEFMRDQLMDMMAGETRITNPQVPGERVYINCKNSARRRSGGSNTTLGNSVVMQDGMARFVRYDLAEICDKSYESIEAFEYALVTGCKESFARMGYKLKVFVRNSASEVTFLKGQLLPRFDGAPIWCPSFAKVVRMGHMFNDPNTLASYKTIKGLTKEHTFYLRCSSFMADVLYSYKNYPTMPIIRILAAKTAHLRTGFDPNSLENYARMKTDNVYEDVDWTPMLNHYGITTEEMADLENILQNRWTPGVAIKHIVFEKLLTEYQ